MRLKQYKRGAGVNNKNKSSVVTTVKFVDRRGWSQHAESAGSMSLSGKLVMQMRIHWQTPLLTMVTSYYCNTTRIT